MVAGDVVVAASVFSTRTLIALVLGIVLGWIFERTAGPTILELVQEAWFNVWGATVRVRDPSSPVAGQLLHESFDPVFEVVPEQLLDDPDQIESWLHEDLTREEIEEIYLVWRPRTRWFRLPLHPGAVIYATFYPRTSPPRCHINFLADWHGGDSVKPLRKALERAMALALDQTVAATSGTQRAALRSVGALALRVFPRAGLWKRIRGCEMLTTVPVGEDARGYRTTMESFFGESRYKAASDPGQNALEFASPFDLSQQKIWWAVLGEGADSAPPDRSKIIEFVCCSHAFWEFSHGTEAATFDRLQTRQLYYEAIRDYAIASWRES